MKKILTTIAILFAGINYICGQYPLTPPKTKTQSTKSNGVTTSKMSQHRTLNQLTNTPNSSAPSNKDKSLSISELMANGKAAEEKEDYKEAMKWYRIAADLGNAEAQLFLAVGYQQGFGIDKNDDLAFLWAKKSAEQGNSYGQAFVGLMYDERMGLPDDDDIDNYDEEALKWYNLSAKQGNEYGQLGLGKMYYEGNGVSENYKEAYKWFLKSAEQGNSDAQDYLGYMYANGEGVQMNYSEAIQWYKKSLINGNSNAERNIKQLEELSKNTITVSGQVTDKTGEPLIGCTVFCEGTNNSVATDINGKWMLYNVKPNSTIVFSYVGMDTTKIKVKDNQSIKTKF